MDKETQLTLSHLLDLRLIQNTLHNITTQNDEIKSLQQLVQERKQILQERLQQYGQAN